MVSVYVLITYWYRTVRLYCFFKCNNAFRNVNSRLFILQETTISLVVFKSAYVPHLRRITRPHSFRAPPLHQSTALQAQPPDAVARSKRSDEHEGFGASNFPRSHAVEV